MGAGNDSMETHRAGSGYTKSYCINSTSYKYMKISWFFVILTLIVSIMSSWLAYDISLDEQSNLDIVVAIGTGLSIALTMGGALALQLDNSRLGVNLKVWSWLMWVIMLIVNFCFAGFGIHMPWYPIVIVCLLVLHIGVLHSIIKVKM